MKTIVIINVHSSSEMSFCGGDYSGYKEFDIKKDAEQFIKENKFVINNTYTDEELNFNLVYLKTLEYNHRLGEVKQLFIEGDPKESKLYWDKQEELENQQRKEQGYIRCKKYDDMKAEDFKGNLNKSLTNDVLNYIATGKGVFGYMGHSARTHNHDKAIEEIFESVNFILEGKELDKWKAFGTWLTSSNARHFMDSVEDEDIEAFKRAVKDNITDIVVKGFIYDLPEHKGGYGDTIRLTKIYEDKIKVAWN